MKDEIEDGIFEVSNEHYENGVKKIDAVMKQAALVPISHNSDVLTYNWIAAREKKGVCHMLVGDERLKWVDNDDKEWIVQFSIWSRIKMPAVAFRKKADHFSW